MDTKVWLSSDGINWKSFQGPPIEISTVVYVQGYYYDYYDIIRIYSFINFFFFFFFFFIIIIIIIIDILSFSLLCGTSGVYFVVGSGCQIWYSSNLLSNQWKKSIVSTDPYCTIVDMVYG